MTKKSLRRLIIEGKLAQSALLVALLAAAFGQQFQIVWLQTAALPLLVFGAILVFRVAKEWKTCTDPTTPADERLNFLLAAACAALLIAPFLVLALVRQTERAWIVFGALTLTVVAGLLSGRFRSNKRTP